MLLETDQAFSSGKRRDMYVSETDHSVLRERYRH